MKPYRLTIGLPSGERRTAVMEASNDVEVRLGVERLNAEIRRECPGSAPVELPAVEPFSAEEAALLEREARAHEIARIEIPRHDVKLRDGRLCSSTPGR